jgi:hypothetical protein
LENTFEFENAFWLECELTHLSSHPNVVCLIVLRLLLGKPSKKAMTHFWIMACLAETPRGVKRYFPI